MLDLKTKTLFFVARTEGKSHNSLKDSVENSCKRMCGSKMHFRPRHRLTGIFGNRAGLTLGEMLVVLAVFTILTLLFVFNSQDLMVRTRHSRVLQDQRVLADQLEFYQLNFLRIPTDDQGLNRVLNPFAELREVPIDPFSRAAGVHEPYVYYSRISPEHPWIIVSRGPDGTLDVAPLIEERKRLASNDDSQLSSNGQRIPLSVMSAAEAQEFLVRHSYDPTNGIVSAGDIIKIQHR